MKAFTKIMIVMLAILLCISSNPFISLAQSESSSLPDPSELEWNQVAFGQSVDLNFSANVLPEKVGVNHAIPEYPGTIDGEIFMESRGGKIAPGHDGLTFYYTTLDANKYNFVLEADFIFEQFGPETDAGPNSQQGGGIMVRDVNGPPRQDPFVVGMEEVPAASNLFAVGLMRDGMSAMARTGVTEPWGTVGSSWMNSRFSNEVPSWQNSLNMPIRLKLERTDTEFIMTTTFLDLEGQPTYERSVQGADLVQVIDEDKMQVGFFASRNIALTVSNASITLSEANTQPTPVVEPSPANPFMNIVSPADSGSHTYDLKVLANYDGTITVLKDDQEVVENAEVKGMETFTHTASLDNDSTKFEVIYTPTDGPSNDPITREITVNKRIFDSGDGLFVSPDGTSDGAGTKEDPLDIHTAIKYVNPGETIFMLGGTYHEQIRIDSEYSGQEGAMKTLAPYDGQEVIFDGEYQRGTTLTHNADYWHFVGFELTQSTDNGVRMNGSHNIVESMTFSFNRGSGFQISGSGSNPDNWPQHNLVISSVAHDNRDLSDINADGFAAKLGVGVGNVFRGNIAHNNIDDGWDFYNRINEGPNMPITLDGNIAYSNGKLSDGYREDGTSGSGFKVGGEGLPVAHIIKNNIAFDNNQDGFTDNFNPGNMTVENNTSFDNKGMNFAFRANPYIDSSELGVFRNNVSFRTNSEFTNEDHVNGDIDATNFFFDGEKTVNSAGVVVDASHFESLSVPTFEWDSEGNIILGDFVRLTSDSLLNTAGTNGSYVGAVPSSDSSTPPGDDDDETPPADELEEVIKELKDRIAELEQKISELEDSSELEELENRLGELEAALAELETTNEDLLEVIAELEAQLNDLRTAFAELVASLEDSDDSNEEGETPQEDENGDSEGEDDTAGDGASNDDDKNESTNGASKGSDKDGDKLPNTATGMYNYLLIGALLLLVAGGVLLYRRKQVA
ncbi:right-handed parallel beta-helix repeat-containing protein [Evansella sp. AB-P1]|uniref:LPXTG cell wall anchor domain-containing protein n=1 Tax=Evansella sp. AB-P1 TaxID=3037653 RepID=UPI00241D16F9|nr:right-handed parallel beta-helix repeat-containing protein [Evansella sp. AB-P1]MDG5789342.1 right-handed parallel beta-helix repeat-containing protein [Evansella sp. AB-P1]